MGKYDDVSYRLITHIDRAFPFLCCDSPRDWERIDEVLSQIPSGGERLMTKDEVKVFYG